MTEYIMYDLESQDLLKKISSVEYVTYNTGMVKY